MGSWTFGWSDAMHPIKLLNYNCCQSQGVSYWTVIFSSCSRLNWTFLLTEPGQKDSRQFFITLWWPYEPNPCSLVYIGLHLKRAFFSPAPEEEALRLWAVSRTQTNPHWVTSAGGGLRRLGPCRSLHNTEILTSYKGIIRLCTHGWSLNSRSTFSVFNMLVFSSFVTMHCWQCLCLEKKERKSLRGAWARGLRARACRCHGAGFSWVFWVGHSFGFLPLEWQKNNIGLSSVNDAVTSSQCAAEHWWLCSSAVTVLNSRKANCSGE